MTSRPGATARIAARCLPLILLGGTACRTDAPSSEETEAALQRDVRNVVRDEAFVLFSPCDEDTTAAYTPVVRDQEALVRRLFADAGPPPVRFYLVPVDAKAGASEHNPWDEATSHGFGGFAFDTGFALVFVHRGSTSAWSDALYGAATLRHELAHVHARRAGLVRERWYREGLACEVESMDVRGAELRTHVFPPSLLAARKSARPGSMVELLAWERHDLPAQELARLYVQSQSLFRFLVERQPEGSWLQRAQVVMALEEEQIRALETAWLEWLAHLDALKAIARGVRSADENERRDSAGELPVLAENGARELFTRGGDELALGLLSDRVCRSPAARFLLYFRAKALTEADVAALDRSDDPALCLTGLALRERRGEPFDVERARAAWGRTAEKDRDGLQAQRSLLGLDAPGDPR